MTITCTDDSHRGDVYSAQCPCRVLLDIVANKWSALAIGALEEGPLRFGDLRRTLDGITPKVLTATLRRLESADIVSRTVFAEVPLHTEYELTDLGLSAAEPLAAMRRWAEQHLVQARTIAAAPGR